jgi:hypothetical protein
MDTTGTTSDVGKDYALGMDEAFKFINEPPLIKTKFPMYQHPIQPT